MAKTPPSADRLTVKTKLAFGVGSAAELIALYSVSSYALLFYNQVLGVKAACRALGLPRSTYYRSVRPPAPRRISPPRRPHPRALSSDEQAAVRGQLNSERFVDRAPRAIYATLLDEGIRLCHWRTMYRLLRADAASRFETARAARSWRADARARRAGAA